MSAREIEQDVMQRNALRASVGLPLPDDREVKRLMAVQDEAAFARLRPTTHSILPPMDQ